MTPLVRVVRSYIQVILGVAAAIPAIVGMLGIDASTTAKVAAYTGAVVLLVTSVQNALEKALGRSIGALPTDTPPARPPLVPPDTPTTVGPPAPGP